MAMLEALLTAVAHAGARASADPLRTASLVGQLADTVGLYSSDRGKQLLTHVLLPWASGVAQKAVGRWTLPAHLPPSCQMVTGPSACGALAVGACHVCGRPICLGHALVAADATIACWACLKLAGQHAKPWQPEQAKSAAPSDKWAYDLLGLERGCSVKQAKKAYRERIARFHPDKVPAGQDPRVNADLVRMLKRAYDAIVGEDEKP